VTKTLRASAGIGAAIALFGALLLAAWLLRAPRLAFGVPLLSPPRPNTSIAFILLGVSLCAWARDTAPARALGRVAAGAAALLAAVTLAEHATGWSLGLDELFVRDLDTPPELHPGRMAVSTAVGLTLAAVAMLLIEPARRGPRMGGLARACSEGVIAIGVLGLIGHALDIAFLYTWYAPGAMAVSTSAALALLGAGLWCAWRAVAARPAGEDGRITRAAAVLLIVAAGGTGIAGIAALESQVERGLVTELRHVLAAHLGELTTNLDLRQTRAQIITTRPDMLRSLRRLAADPAAAADAGRVVREGLESFAGHGFEFLRVTRRAGEVIAQIGDPPGPAAVEMPVGGDGAIRLLWRDGFVLRHELPLVDADGVLGTLVAEQGLGRATRLIRTNQTGFPSGEFLLCRPVAARSQCFPSRLSAAPITVSLAAGGTTRLAQRALREGAGVGTAIDYRGHEVLGAYEHLPSSGLVAVLKVDVEEVYAPIRRQVGLALLMVATVIVGGVGLVRLRVRPLASELEARVQARTADLLRTTERLEREVAERARAEAALASSAARLGVLHEIDRAIIALDEPSAIAEAALRRLAPLLGDARTAVALFDYAAGEAQWLVAQSSGRGVIVPGGRVPLPDAVELDALRRGAIQEIDVARRPPRALTESLGRAGIDFFVRVPLLAGGELIGALSVAARGRRTFSADEVQIAREVADQLAIALAQARLRAELLDRQRQTEASEARFRALVESAPIAIYVLDGAGRVALWNAAAERTFGWSADEVLGRPLPTAPEPARSESGTRAPVTGDRPGNSPVRQQVKSGQSVDLLLSAAPLRGADGQVSGTVHLAVDVTERRRLEDQFRQAQKLESIGQLAGGVAHDLNNLLSVVIGRGQMLLVKLSPEASERRAVSLMVSSAKRGVAVVKQLLTFSRRQAVDLHSLDLNRVIDDIVPMLRRFIGEQIELCVLPGERLGRVWADKSQIEQIVMNLVINARDAMPHGGRVTLETADVELTDDFAATHVGATAGPHVLLAVMDTGAGMDAATQARIFEPFFTTKEPGKGTGLGLATVYGIVIQSHGSIWVDSEPGRGTAFRVYLPRVDAEPVEAPAATGGAPEGSETVLIAEDEAAVRELVRDILRSFGYTVLVATDPADAMLIAERHTGPIHLLLTDVIMPGGTGRDLAERLGPLRPRMRILYMSGYPGDAIVQRGGLEPGTEYLQKPFAPDDLGAKVRAVLDAPD